MLFVRRVPFYESGQRLPALRAHPTIAGSEQSGVEASTPPCSAGTRSSHAAGRNRPGRTGPGRPPVARAGADVEHMTVERHDEVLAATSHLPHLLAAGLVDSLAETQ